LLNFLYYSSRKINSDYSFFGSYDEKTFVIRNLKRIYKRYAGAEENNKIKPMRKHKKPIKHHKKEIPKKGEESVC
jgi:hypothetical protein